MSKTTPSRYIYNRNLERNQTWKHLHASKPSFARHRR